MLKCIAIIPARGGSKGIPGKNLATLGGKTLLARSIQAARESEFITDVIVSTDDELIKRDSLANGAVVIDRPPSISGDLSSSEDALLHALKASQVDTELVVFLQCTSPLTVAADIDGTIKCLLEQDADTAVAVVPFHYFLWRRGADGGGVGINHSPLNRLMRQQREPEFLEAGAVYVMRTTGFLQHKHRFFGKTALYEMPCERCWEIDEPADLAVAETLIRQANLAARYKLLPAKLDAVVFDFDGVFTDNGVWVDETGAETVRCNRADGLGIELAKDANIPMMILSKEKNPVVARRAEKLRLPVIHGVDKKKPLLDQWLSHHGYCWENLVYIGNDVNDIDCILSAGCGVAVADAVPEVTLAANLVLERPGGQGAIRELLELILKSRT